MNLRPVSALAVAFFGLLFVAGAAHADAVPSTTNTTLKDNQTLLQAQGVAAVTTFFASGAQTCDQNGLNCHSMMGADDSLNYTAIQNIGQTTMGTQAISFNSGDGNSTGDATSVASQTGSVAIACGDTSAHTVSGIAVAVSNCNVDATGNAQITMQVCTAPSRGNPVKEPDNAVPCSSNPSDASFVPPTGKVCWRPSCDTSPVGDENGWSKPVTLTYIHSLPANATETDTTNNGLGIFLYPDSGAAVSVNADSQSLTAAKIVETARNNQTGATAVGMNIAYRYKTALTQAQLTTSGLGAGVANPASTTSAWDTVTKLQANPLINQYASADAAMGTNCLEQIQNGISSTGKISVCNPSYNQDGIKPIATTAQVAVQDQNCSTTPQCLQSVVNTNTWTQTCQADVPLGVEKCETITPYTIDNLVSNATRTDETCYEKRASAQYSCSTTATVGAPGCPVGDTTCTRVPTCTIGQQYSVTMNGATGMAHDSCDGGDYIQASWTCTNDDSPPITMFTNSKLTGGNISTSVPTNGSALLNIDGSCYGQMTNATQCTNGQCTGVYTMTLGYVSCNPTEANSALNTVTCAYDGTCTNTDSNVTCSSVTDDSGARSVTCSVKSNPQQSCTSYAGGVTCTCSTSDMSFQPHDFGAGSQITVEGKFSMAETYSLTIDDQCTTYEQAESN